MTIEFSGNDSHRIWPWRRPRRHIPAVIQVEVRLVRSLLLNDRVLNVLLINMLLLFTLIKAFKSRLKVLVAILILRTRGDFWTIIHLVLIRVLVDVA